MCFNLIKWRSPTAEDIATLLAHGIMSEGNRSFDLVVKRCALIKDWAGERAG